MTRPQARQMLTRSWRWISEEGLWLPTTKLFRHLWGALLVSWTDSCFRSFEESLGTGWMRYVCDERLGASWVWWGVLQMSNIQSPRAPSVRLITANSDLSLSSQSSPHPLGSKETHQDPVQTGYRAPSLRAATAPCQVSDLTHCSHGG